VLFEFLDLQQQLRAVQLLGKRPTGHLVVDGAWIG